MEVNLASAGLPVNHSTFVVLTVWSEDKQRQRVKTNLGLEEGEDRIYNC